jgi:outer membrane immunogenic protein
MAGLAGEWVELLETVSQRSGVQKPGFRRAVANQAHLGPDLVLLRIRQLGRVIDMKLALLGTTALVAFAANGMTQAADLAPAMPVKAPPLLAAAPFSWTGFYAGVVGGYSWRDPSIVIGGNAAATTGFLAPGFVPGAIPVDPKGALGGLQAGYNYQSGPAIFGFETDFSYTNIHDGRSIGGLPRILISGGKTTTLLFKSSGDQKLDWFGTARGRLGFTPSNGLLVFASGGLAYGHAKLNSSVLNTSGTELNGGVTTILDPCTSICASGSTNRWLVGWAAGAGAEYAFSRSWSAKLEYLFYDLGDLSVSFSDPAGAPVFNASTHFKGNIVRAGLSYKFN